jgi:hypothetical protein
MSDIIGKLILVIAVVVSATMIFTVNCTSCWFSAPKTHVVKIKMLRILDSNGVLNSQLYRVWDSNNRIYKIENSMNLQITRAGELFGQLEKGKVCTFRTRHSSFSRYPSIIDVSGCM